MSDERDAYEQHPSALDLIDAAREHLATRVLPAITDPRLRFETLVATHVLGVASRELSRGPEMAAATDAARAALPGAPADDAALCRLIEQGRYDGAEAGAALRRWMQSRTELSLFAWNPLFLMRVKG
ncbi:MAG: hypothetical protein JWM10_1479 [Myxococcaceae bacterium]|nr:hypothetical protein [Myxococcaceae bacterium]